MFVFRRVGSQFWFYIFANCKKRKKIQYGSDDREKRLTNRLFSLPLGREKVSWWTIEKGKMKKEDKFVNWVKIKADAVGQERGGAYLEKFWILFMMISPWALSVSLKQMPMLYFSFLLMNAKFRSRFNENCPTPIRGSMWSVDTCHFFADDSTDVWLNRNTQLPKNDHDVHGDNAHHWGVGCRSYQIWNKPHS